MGAPLQLPQPHLDEEQHEDADAEREEPRCVFPSRGEIAEAEQEREQEDPHDYGVRVDDRLQASEPVDLVRGASARMRSRGGRERTTDDEDESGDDEREAEP